MAINLSQYYGPQVSTEFTRGAQASANDFGAIAANQTMDLGDSLQSVSNAMHRGAIMQRNQEDEAFVNDGLNKLSQWEQTTLNDPNNGYFTKLGKNALGGSEIIGKDFESQISQISGSLGTERQRRLFDEQARSRREAIIRSVSRHEATQKRNWTISSIDGNIKLAADGASQFYNDPEMVREYKTRGVEALTSKADILGSSKEELQADIQSFQASIDKEILDTYSNINPNEAINALNSGRFNHLPKSELDEYRASFNKRIAAERKKEMAQVLKDAEAELQATGASEIRPSDDAIRQTYGKDADKIIEGLNKAQQFGETLDAIRLAPPEEVEKIIEANRPSGENFLEESQNLNVMLQAVKSRETAIKKDPFLYSVQNDELTRSAALEYEQNPSPENMQRLVQESINVQNKLGIQDRDKKILSAQSVASLIRDINETAPTERAQLIQSYENLYGEYWPDVYPELVEAGLSEQMSVALRLNTVDKRKVQADLMEADAQHQEIQSAVKGDPIRSIRETVESEMSDFATTVIAQPNNLDELQRTRTAVENLAGYYFLQGDDEGTAAKKAVKGVIGDYQYVGKARVPRNYDIDAVEEGISSAYELIATSNKIDVPIVGSMAGIPDDIIREQYLDELKDGYVITNQSETGVIFFDKNGFVVTRNGGDPLELTFEEIEMMSKGKKPAADYYTRPMSSGDEELRRVKRRYGDE